MKALSDRRVLVVDDLKANVQLLAKVLQGEYQVSVAFDGESALRSIAESPPDLVLLDIMMPGLDGYEVLRRLRADPATCELPVMFLSALEDVGEQGEGIRARGERLPRQAVRACSRSRRGSARSCRARAWSEAVRETMERELAIARSIQMGILPRDLSPVTRETGLDVAARLEPAQQVGGDLYLALRTAPDEVFVAVGDVSGKGIPASLFMAVTVTILRTLARQGLAPHEVLARVNEELVEQNAGDLFVTLVCARIALVLRPGRDRQRGPPGPPAGRSRDAAPFRPFTTSGLVAGFRGGESYESDVGTLAPGEMLVFFSDGIPEAWSASGEAFGQERLADLLATRAGHGARDVVDAVIDAVHAHAAGAAQSDDITILALRRLP